jgi:acyl-CoA synthetase (NDP forming)/GNAT superfamily N-acetyltransferase
MPTIDAGGRPGGSATVLERFDRDVLLATGRAVRIRPSGDTDVAAMRSFYESLSDRSTYFRFFGLRPALLDPYIDPAAALDIEHRVVLLAYDGDELIGIGEYIRVPGRPEAEVAFAVADSHQHEGVATVLLEDLALIARAAGLTKLVAETLATNDAMLVVFRSVGLVTRSWYDAGQIHVELDLTGESLLEDRADGRDWVAAVASLRPILEARHVVVIGAGRDPSSVGRQILGNLRQTFHGRVSVVHPVVDDVDGIATTRRVGDLDAIPDLAIVAVPAAHVTDVVEQCGRAGVRAAVVISAGFAEAGDDGVARERDLILTARRHGMRIVGPNCLGVVSTGVGLDATFMRHPLRAGSIAIASQSGGVGIVLADEAARRDLGVSTFVSMGNKADVSGNDLLRYWVDDPATRVGLMYLESIGNPLRFARVARAASRRLPLVALKSGRSEAGRRGARSHTAALAADDAGIDALFAHTGVIRAHSLDHLLDIAALLVDQPAPSGRRVALVGNTGGPLILAADAAAANHLDVVELSGELQDRLRAFVPDAAALANPIDLLATATPDQYRAVLDTIAVSGEVDACAVIHVNLASHAAAAPLPLDWSDRQVTAAAVLLGGATAVGSMPRYPTPERAIAALSSAADRGAWLASVASEPFHAEDVDLLALRHRARSLAEHSEPNGWLVPSDTFELLSALGVPVASWAVATTAADCVRQAQRLGFPCVLKAVVPGIVHKTEAGAVICGIDNAAAARRAVRELQQRFGSRLHHVLVQQQVGPGPELLVGGVRDPAIGPLVVVGAGGTAAEVLRDRSVMLAPVSDRQARAAVERLRMYPLLTGFRGRPSIPSEPIIDTVGRVGLLMATVPEIAELDLNPVIAAPSGAVVVDARIALSPAPVGPLRGLRVSTGPGSRNGDNSSSTTDSAAENARPTGRSTLVNPD